MPTIKINNTVLSFTTVYYCNSISGNDNNDGLGESTPLKTIQAAINKITTNEPTAIVLSPNSVFEGEAANLGLINIPANTFIAFIGKYTDILDMPIIRSLDRVCIINNSTLLIRFINIRIESLGSLSSGGANNYSTLLNNTVNTSNFYFYNCYLMPRGVVFNSGGSTKIYNSIIDYSGHDFKYELFYYQTGAPSGNKTAVNCIILGTMTCRTGGSTSNTATFSYSIVPRTNLSFHTLTASTNKRLNTTTSHIDEKYKILLNEQYWKNQGDGLNYTGDQAHIGIYGGPYALNASFIKYFIFHNSLYKVYDENTTTWSTPIDNNIPTSTDYEEYGMETIPINNLQELDGSKSIVTYFDNLDSKIVTIKSLPKPTTITSNNVSLSDIHEIQSITLTATNQNTSTIKIAISPNDGNEWFVYNDEQWSICNDIATDGNTITEFNSIETSFNSIINLNDKKLKFKFYLNLNNVNDTLEIDKLSYKVDLKGIWRTGTEGNVKYVVDFTTNNTCQLKLLEPGSYKINY